MLQYLVGSDSKSGQEESESMGRIHLQVPPYEMLYVKAI